MTTRTDYIVNLYPNAIVDISKDSPAVVTVPVVERVVSATGIINSPTATGSGASGTNTVTATSPTATIYVGMTVTGTNVGAGAVVTGISGTTLFLSVNNTGTVSGTLTFSNSVTGMTTTAGLKVGDIITATDDVGSFGSGTVSVTSVAGNQAILIKSTDTITAGTVTDISLPAVSTLPPLMVNGDAIQITNVGGMTEILTAGLGGTNTFYVDLLTDTTFALYKDAELNTAVDSSAFTTATANTGQYTTFTAVTKVID